MHFGHTGNRREAVGNHVVGVVIQIVNGRVARQKHVGDGHCVDVDLVNERALRAGRQVGENDIESLAHILRGCVHIHRQIELQHHGGHIFEAGGFDVFQAVNSRHGVFNQLGDVFFNILRRRAEPCGHHGDIGNIHRGHVFDGELAESVQPKPQQGNEQTAHGNGAARGCIR